MIIGYDASRAFTARKTGVENYSFELLRAMLDLRIDHRFVVYTRKKKWDVRGGKLDDPSHLSPLTSRPIQWPFLWTQGGLALETWLRPPDILFIPAHTVPFFKRPGVKTVVTVHDLWTHDLPQAQNPIQRLYLNLRLEKLRARVSDHLIAVSEATKQDVVRLLEVPEEKVSVVYEGVNSRRFAPALKAQGCRLKEIREKYGVGERYLLFVGTLQPRKNLVRLIQAFSNLDSRPSNLELILAGKPGWQTDEIYTAPRRFGVEDRVKFIDYVDDADLPYLYAGAHALVLVSLHEGFGLPVLEAMACGTPVVVSQVSSLPEVAGETGIYVDPEDVESTAAGIVQVLELGGAEYQKLSQACVKQAQKFTWHRAAQETLAVLEQERRTE